MCYFLDIRFKTIANSDDADYLYTQRDDDLEHVSCLFHEKKVDMFIHHGRARHASTP